jgi:hypothetical protein
MAILLTNAIAMIALVEIIFKKSALYGIIQTS